MKKVWHQKNTQRIRVQVVLGNPRIGCDGYGICKFITKTDSINFINSSRLIKTHLCIVNEDLHLVFNKADILEKVYQRYFSGGIFKVETEIQLPKTITDLFGIPPSVWACGNYRIYENDWQMGLHIALIHAQPSKHIQYERTQA